MKSTFFFPLEFFLHLGVQWVARIVSNALDNAQALGLALPEEYPIARSEELRALHESESNKSTIARSDVGAVNVNDGACLTDCPDMKHRLIPGFNRCRVGQDKN
jgi:hypothetical protein